MEHMKDEAQLQETTEKKILIIYFNQIKFVPFVILEPANKCILCSKS
jgi:hypothetical protein